MTDYTVGDTVYKRFTTRQFSDGVPTTLAGTPAVSAYEDDSITQITAGITLGVDHDGVAGLNLLTIVATGANGFETGKSYDFVITTGTVGGVSVVGEVVWHFTLSAEAAAIDLANGTDGLGALKTGIDGIPTTAEFEARTLVAAAYFDPATDAVATVTDVTNDVGITQAGADKVWGTAARILTASTNFNDLSAAEVNSQVDTALTDIRLDELLAADSDIDGAAPPTVGSVFHELMTKTAGSFTYDQTADSLEAIRDRGDAEWITATGFSTHSAANVWAVDATGQQAQGTFGQAIGDPGATAKSLWQATVSDAAGVSVSADVIAVKAETALIVADTNELQTDDVPGLIAALNDLAAGDVWAVDATTQQTQGTFGQAIGDPVADTTTIYQAVATDAAGDNVSIDVAAVKAETALIVADTGTTLDTKLNDIQGATFSSATDSLEAIRDRGDAAWTTGAGGSPPTTLQNTTIATLASQVSFTLTAGSADDGAYVGAMAVVEDSATSTQKAVGVVSAYTGATKTVTLAADPGVFTMAAGDTIDIVAITPALPAALSDGAGGLPVSDAGGLDLDAKLAETNEVTATRMAALTDWIDGGRLDLILDARMAEASISTTAGAVDTVTSVTNQVTADMTAVSGDSVAADNLELDYDGTGYDKANSIIGTTTTNTDMRGTDSAATAANLATVQADLDIITGAAGALLDSTATSAQLVDDILDEVNTGAAHNVVNSLGRQVREMRETNVYGGRIWIDTVNGAAGTTDYENGIIDNPVNNIANAVILSASLGINRFDVAPGSSITLASTFTSYIFDGVGWTLALGGQDVSGSNFIGANISGIGTGTTTVNFMLCRFGNTTLPPSHGSQCHFDATITVGSAGTFIFDHCHSAIAGTGAPVWDFAAVGNTDVSLRHYSGGIQIESMGDTGTDTMSVEGDGQVIEGTCTGGTVAIRGNITVSGITNLTLSDDARIDVAQINAEADTALADYDGPTNAEMEARTLAAGPLAQLSQNLDDCFTGTASGTPTTTTMVSDIGVTVDDQFNGRIITFDDDTTTAAVRGQSTDITGCTAASNTLTFTALTTAPVNGDTFVIT